MHSQKSIKTYLDGLVDQYNRRKFIATDPVALVHNLMGNANRELGCAAKRMNLFLRWMVRHDAVDLGLWHCVEKSMLIIPLDTHIARTAKELRLTTKKCVGWGMAQEITERLKAFDPRDPVKYDFAITRAAMLR